MARSHGLKTKTLRRMLKKKGMKTTGKKATLMKRLHMRGGMGETHKVILKDDTYIIVDTTPAQVPVPDSAISGNEAGFASFAAAKKAFDDAKVPDATLDTADPAAAPDAPTEEGGRRRRRRSRRREEGGRRRKHTARKEMLGY
jgi:hypothetical protein